MAAPSWAERALQLLGRMNSFHSQGSTKAICTPFYVAGQEVGVIQPRVRALLPSYPDVFQVSQEKPGRVDLREGLDTYHARSQALKHVLDHWRELEMFDCLRGWRNESYEVMRRFCDEPLMEMERSAASLFGIKTYGIHVNGYVRQEGGAMAMWIGRRSRTKQTFPGMLDNMSAGGLSAGSGVLETLVRECAEESCIPQSVALNARPAGSISYTYEDQRGVFPQCQFVYDLEVPAGLAPRVGDGEVQEFYLWPLEKIHLRQKLPEAPLTVGEREAEENHRVCVDLPPALPPPPQPHRVQSEPSAARAPDRNLRHSQEPFSTPSHPGSNTWCPSSKF